MDLDPLFLSRLQWGWVIGWHILLPAFTVGLASYIAVLEGLYFFDATRSGCASRISGSAFSRSRSRWASSTGIVMPFQFGTNWARFSDAAANVISPLLAYEDLMAFFLEATFLGVLLFGRKLVPRWAHFLAACMVAIGTLFSSFWIMAVNSWMQTPAGFEIRDGRFFPTELAGDHLQPVVSLSADAQCMRLLRDDRLRRARASAPIWCGAADSRRKDSAW